MKKLMNLLSIIFTATFGCMLALYFATGVKVFYILSITFGTISYHFDMRLVVGFIVNSFVHNNVNYKKRWFNVGDTELKFYNFLRVKKWKKHIKAYAPETFNIKGQSVVNIVMATCQAEIVHEIIMVLSLVPILFSVWFGEILVFVFSSFASLLFDSVFVIVQRYNRPRLIKLIAKNTK